MKAYAEGLQRWSDIESKIIREKEMSSIFSFKGSAEIFFVV